MRILLLHHEDEFSRFAGEAWDLVIDLARAPASSYMEWSRAAHCRVMSLFDFARGTDDLYDLRRLLEPGLGRVVDRFGIDWWDVVSLMIAEKLQELALLSRFSATLPKGVEMHTSRPHTLSRALGLLTGCTVLVWVPTTAMKAEGAFWVIACGITLTRQTISGAFELVPLLLMVTV